MPCTSQFLYGKPLFPCRPRGTAFLRRDLGRPGHCLARLLERRGKMLARSPPQKRLGPLFLLLLLLVRLLVVFGFPFAHFAFVPRFFLGLLGNGPDRLVLLLGTFFCPSGRAYALFRRYYECYVSLWSCCFVSASVHVCPTFFMRTRSPVACLNCLVFLSQALYKADLLLLLFLRACVFVLASLRACILGRRAVIYPCGSARTVAFFFTRFAQSPGAGMPM